jgi:tetratricopeptide (TPR) repeat protein
LLCSALLLLSPIAVAENIDAPSTDPPAILTDLQLVSPHDSDIADRAWEQVKRETEPVHWPVVKKQPAAALSPVSAAMVQEAEDALQSGDAFKAVQLLRQARELEPDHPAVLRSLGLAYAATGNLTRAASLLRDIAAADRDDVESLLVLARHSAANTSLKQVLTDTAELEAAGAPKALVDLYRARALDRLGYAVAATDRLAAALEAVGQGVDDELPTTVLREWRVAEAMLPKYTLDLGDMHLRSGDYDAAAKAYASLQPADPIERHRLAARRVFLSLLNGKPDAAVQHVISLLAEPDAIDRNAALVDYLAEQGVSPQRLATQLAAMLNERGVILPRLLALSRVADNDAVLAKVRVWLNQGDVSADRLVQAVSLLQFDDEDPADAAALSELLLLVAQSIERSPADAPSRARVAVQAIDAPVTLLRAIRLDAFQANDSDTRRLVEAVAYESAGRKRDALGVYATLLNSNAAFADELVIPVARLQLELNEGAEALALVGRPDVDREWPVFDASIRALAATGEAREALTLVDAYIKANGKSLEADMLRIAMIAQMGQPQEACNLLLRLISSNPSEEALYRLGIDLSYDYRAFFSRTLDAERMRRAFVTRLISNLPDTPLARIGMAQNIRGNPSRQEEARSLLLKVLKQDPDNTAAMSLLVELYDEAEDEVAAATMHARYAKAVGPGVDQALLLAERYIETGQRQRAVDILERTFVLQDEGVLPGPAMTGDDASMLLRELEAADPDRDTEARYLAMLRRFPDHPSLNNALGYRWAVQNKNLLQAEAMIQTALKADNTNHSLLDSLAWVYYKLGRFEKAEETQKRALQQMANFQARFRGIEREMGATIAILNDHMGDIYYRRGNARQALVHWRIAMDQNYSDEDMQLDPELQSLEGRVKAKLKALDEERPVPVADVPGPEAHGPKGHPADRPAE